MTSEAVVLAQDLATPQVLSLLADKALRPATVFELACAALAHRDLGMRTVVAALGSCDVNHLGGSVSPAIAAFEDRRQLVMMGFLRAWPAGTVVLGLPKARDAGHGTVAHNHLLPIEARRSPKLVFTQPPCSVTYTGVPYDGSLSVSVAAKRAKLRNVAEAVAGLPPPGPETRELDITVIDLNRQLRTPEVIAELATRGLRSATAYELVALVAAHPEAIEARQVWSATDRVGVYKAYGRTLGLDVGDPGAPWPFTHAFAGVRD